MSRFEVAGILFGLVGLAVAAPPPKLESLRGEYKAALVAAQADYNKAVQKASEAHKAKLTALQSELTKSGALDGAVSVREELKTLEPGQLPLFSEGKDDPTARSRYISGTWKLRHHPNRSVRTYVIGPGGDVHFVEENLRGLLVANGSTFLLDFGEGKIERVTFGGGRMFVEHYNPKANLARKPEHPDAVGVADLVKKK